jgi:hypothetical protein
MPSYGMPHPAVTVADLIESLSVLPPDARIALVQVDQEWSPLEDPTPVTTLTLKVWGGFELQQRRTKSIEARAKALPKQPARLT